MSSTVSAEQTPDGMSGIIEKLISNGINNLRVQDKYILPPHERPQMSEVSYSQSIPVVDLQDLDGPNRTELIHQIRYAGGFFQVHEFSISPYQQFSLEFFLFFSEFIPHS